MMASPHSDNEYAIIATPEGLRAEVRVATGQLVSLSLHGQEYVHGGGKSQETQQGSDATGWQNSEISMFPIVGAVHGCSVTVNGSSVPLDQHGILRLLTPTVTVLSPTELVCSYEYCAGTRLRNPRFGTQPQSPEELWWPYSFTIVKKFLVAGTTVRAEFTVQNESREPMPFEFGWHPALRRQGNEPVLVQTPQGNETVPLAAIVEASKTLAVFRTALGASYGSGKTAVHVTWSTPHVALWSPDGAPQLCIEPVSHIADGNLHDALVLAPHAAAAFWVTIRCGE